MPSSENDNVADDEFEMDDLDDAEDFEDVDEGDTPNQTQPNNAWPSSSNTWSAAWSMIPKRFR
jgi:hypothetical protein